MIIGQGFGSTEATTNHGGITAASMLRERKESTAIVALQFVEIINVEEVRQT